MIMNNYECEQSVNGHVWVAGMMYVHEEDARQTAIERARFGGHVECEACEQRYDLSGGE